MDNHNSLWTTILLLSLGVIFVSVAVVSSILITIDLTDQAEDFEARIETLEARDSTVVEQSSITPAPRTEDEVTRWAFETSWSTLDEAERNQFCEAVEAFGAGEVTDRFNDNFDHDTMEQLFREACEA